MNTAGCRASGRAPSRHRRRRRSRQRASKPDGRRRRRSLVFSSSSDPQVIDRSVSVVSGPSAGLVKLRSIYRDGSTGPQLLRVRSGDARTISRDLLGVNGGVDELPSRIGARPSPVSLGPAPAARAAAHVAGGATDARMQERVQPERRARPSRTAGRTGSPRSAPGTARSPTAAPSTPTGSARCGGGRGRGSSAGGGGDPCRRWRRPAPARPGGRSRTACRGSARRG